MANKTIFNAYNDTKRELMSSGVEDFGFEARVIIRHITGFDNKKILLNYNNVLTDYQTEMLNKIIARRKERYPLQYILGEWEFYGLKFKVGEGVLIPRPDTEILVDTALQLIKDIETPKVLDLCAGSGAIGIAVSGNRPDSEVYLLEKSQTAIGYLVQNIALNKTTNAKSISGDVFAGDLSDKKYDLIVSNPPYIKSDDMKTLQTEVKYEPAMALDGGNDGLDFYKAIVGKYSNSLNNGGSICFEVGINQAEDVKKLLVGAGLSGVDTAKDLNGIDRVVFGTVK